MSKRWQSSVKPDRVTTLADNVYARLETLEAFYRESHTAGPKSNLRPPKYEAGVRTSEP